MNACGLFEARFLDDWEESRDKSWTVTLPLFTQQFNKERRTLERAHNNKNYESSNVFHERRATGSYGHNATPTMSADYTAAMEYAAVMEIKSTQQEGRILELEDALDGRTTVTLPHELAASATTTTAPASATATEMAAMRALIQSLAASVTVLCNK